MAAPVIENWVKLEPGVSKRLRFAEYRKVRRVITDPFFRRPREVEGLVFRVVMEDGREVDKIFSVLSERLAGELSGYLVGDRFRHYEFTFIKDAPGTVAPRLVSATPV